MIRISSQAVFLEISRIYRIYNIIPIKNNVLANYFGTAYKIKRGRDYPASFQNILFSDLILHAAAFGKRMKIFQYRLGHATRLSRTDHAAVDFDDRNDLCRGAG